MSFKKKKADGEKDELHREYGVLGNSFWILGRIRKYKPALIWLMVVGVFTNSLMQYMWSFIGKFVIDMVQRQASSTDNSVKPLVILLCITTAVELVSMGVNTYIENKRWIGFIYVRLKLIVEKVAKSLDMNYETLEDPKMLDRMEKAGQATNGNNVGCEGMIHSIYGTMVQLLLILVTLSTLATLNVLLVAVIVVMALLQYIFFIYTAKKDKKNVWDKLAPTWRKLSYMEQTTQDFSYAKDIRIFGMKNRLSKKQSEINAEKYRRYALNKNYWSYNSVYAHTLSLIRNAVTYGYLIYCVVSKDLSIGSFTLYLGIAGTFSGSLTTLLNGLGDYKRCSMQVDDFRSFLDIPSDDNTDTVPIPKCEGYTFTFENVSFKYKGQETYAVKNLNLTLEQGKRLAVVGLNGAGKTTFIKLLLRLYDVTEGRILLNGIDIRRFDRKEYYELFAPVFQNVEIFAFPMSENVSMRSPSVTDCGKAEECLRRAGMGDKIDELADGVHTELLKVVYDDGVDLSGGQKQKLALARALYKDAPIVVLDEPTAALDALAEYKLYKDFDGITEGKSAVYISHRLSSTRFCDGIAMFRSGEMIEYGTHDKLLAKGGAYAEMFEVQAQYYKDSEKEEATADV